MARKTKTKEEAIESYRHEAETRKNAVPVSAVCSRVTGSSDTKVLGRSSSTEIMQPDYRFLDQDLKLLLTRLSKGELLLQHAIFRQPVKVVFPKPAYRQ